MSQYPAVIALADLDGTDGFRLDGSQGQDLSGWSVASAGDINGDGYADIIIGAYNASNSADYAGSAYVVYGKESGFSATSNLSALDGSDGFRLDGVTTGDNAGLSVASAGDINGDGYDDFVIGAAGADPNDSRSGSTYVVFGKASGFDASADLSILDGSNGFRLDGAARHDYSGYSVASAGDVNGDGFADLIVGAFAADPNGSRSGSSYVVFGKASGFDATMELSALDGTDGFRLDGAAAYDYAGHSVASAGDVNGDGFADLIIGAWNASTVEEYSGSSYVVFGKASGFDATMDLSALDGTDGFRLDGGAYHEYSGRSVASAGDVNGDGFADLIIGAFGAAPNGYYSGSSYVVFGKASGFAAAVDLTSLDGSDGFRVDGVAAYDLSGFSVASAGDVNGDGFDDLIIGAYQATPNGYSSGSSYVVFGKASGFDATLDLSALDGTDGFRIDGTTDYDRSGRSVASAGDVNGDGLDDLIVGAFTSSPNGLECGSTFVIFGQLPDARVDRSGTEASQSLVGGDLKDTLKGRGGDDVLWGHGGKDTLAGGTGDDTLIGGSGRDNLSGQNGNDVFVFKAVTDSPTADRDIIKDLSTGDIIDLSAIDADTTTAGDQAFTLVSAFSGTAGEMTLTTSANGHRTILDADVDGDGVADFTIKLKGDHHDFTDFVL